MSLPIYIFQYKNENIKGYYTIYFVVRKQETPQTKSQRPFFLGVCPFGFGVFIFVLQNILENLYELDEGFCYNGIDRSVIFGMT